MWNQSQRAEMEEEINVAVTEASRLSRVCVKCPHLNPRKTWGGEKNLKRASALKAGDKS